MRLSPPEPAPGDDVKRLRGGSEQTRSAGARVGGSPRWCAAVAPCTGRSVTGAPPPAGPGPGASCPTWGLGYSSSNPPFLFGGLSPAFTYCLLWEEGVCLPGSVRAVVWDRVGGSSGELCDVGGGAGVYACF